MDEMSVLHAYAQSKARATLEVVGEMREENVSSGGLAPQLVAELDTLAARYAQYMTHAVSLASERLIGIAQEISHSEINR